MDRDLHDLDREWVGEFGSANTSGLANMYSAEMGKTEDQTKSHLK